MSILLEALRKSEKSQRPLAPPTIHADEPESMATEPLRAVPLALLIVAALLITAWLAWRQYQPAADVYQPPVTLPTAKPAPKPAAVTTPVAKQDKGKSRTATQKSNDVSGGGKRTPVESYAPPATNVDVSGDTEMRRGQAVKNSTGPVAKTTAKQAQAGQKKGGKKGGKKGKKSAAATKPGDTAQAGEEYQSPKPEPISYWALPDAVRADVPEIKFSVLVYADVPADRFVLMNGQRLGEGDSYQEGLVVKEIRRDGVVFSYRLYQFLVRR